MKKQKVLLLMPFDFHQSWPLHNDFSRYLNRVPAVTYPLLAALHSKVDFIIIDGLVTRFPINEFKKIIKDINIVCINCTSSTISLNIEVNIKVIKSINPSVKIILGGHHATFYSDDWILKGTDFVVRQEAEVTFPKLLDALINNEKPNKIQGLTYYRKYKINNAIPNNYKNERSQDDIIKNNDQDLIENLDSSPIPRWDLMDLSNYDLEYNQDGYTASIETSRGCNHNCDFCATKPMWNNCQRFKSVARVIEEFKLLKELGVNNTFIIDDNFGANKNRDLQIFDQLLRLNIKMNLKTVMRADAISNNHELIQKASKVGLREVLIGYESISEQDIKSFKKNYTGKLIEIYRETYKLLKKHHIAVVGLFIVNYPGQNDFKNILKLHSEVNKICDVALFSAYRPNIGTMQDYQTYTVNNHKIKMKNMFYYDRYIPTFSIDNKPHKQTANFNNFVSILPFTKIKQWFTHNNERRRILLIIYRYCLKNLFVGISLKRIIHFFIKVCPFMTPERKRKFINKDYLKSSYINSIAGD